MKVYELMNLLGDIPSGHDVVFRDGGGVGHSGWRWDRSHGYVYPTCRDAFSNLWNTIYQNWKSNPWVWVYEFKIVEVSQ